jgi:hypothetical protein
VLVFSFRVVFGHVPWELDYHYMCTFSSQNILFMISVIGSLHNNFDRVLY